MPILYPYKMSDWYGYCKVCTSPVTSFSSSIIQTSSTVCSATINQTYYHDGSGSLPVVNDKVYSNAAGSNLLAAGNYKISGSFTGTCPTYFQSPSTTINLDNVQQPIQVGDAVSPISNQIPAGTTVVNVSSPLSPILSQSTGPYSLNPLTTITFSTTSDLGLKSVHICSAATLNVSVNNTISNVLIGSPCLWHHCKDYS